MSRLPDVVRERYAVVSGPHTWLGRGLIKAGGCAVAVLGFLGIASAQSYNVTLLPLPAGFTVQQARGLNGAGQVVGTVPTQSGNHAYYFDGTTGIDLNSLIGSQQSVAEAINAAGHTYVRAVSANGVFPSYFFDGITLRSVGGLASTVDTRAFAINDSDEIVGESRTASGIEHAFIWTIAGGIVDIQTLGTPYVSSRATAINASGEVTGYVTLQLSNGTSDRHIFLWTANTGMVDIGKLTNSDSSTPIAIGTDTRIVGSAVISITNSAAFNWTQPAGFIQVAGLGGPNTYAYAVNDSGTIVGSSQAFGAYGIETHAFKWTEAAGSVDIGSLGNSSFSRANGINATGQIVGLSQTATFQEHAFLYNNGVMLDLNALVPVGSPELSSADAISDNGLILSDIVGGGLALLTPDGVTPSGSDVSVNVTTSLPDGTSGSVAVSFGTVTSGGTTSATTSTQGPPPPSGFKLGNPPVYYDVTTTATFSGNATICFTWTEGQFHNESALRLWHYDSTLNSWIDVTTSVDTVNNVACGTVTSLSPFALMETAYQFAGFFQPVDNLPTLNSVKAGSAIPVKFSLGGDYGLAIFDAGYPKSQAIMCDSSAAVATVEETVTAGGSSLSYDTASGQYSYIWKSDKSWAGTCWQLIINFNDGSVQKANFKFSK